MFEDAKPRALLAVLASGALLLTLGGWASMLYLTGEAAGKREAVAEGQQVSDRTLDREIAACRQSGTPMAQCTREVVERARETQIDEQTLAAQADAADWGWWMLLLALLQLPLSAMGLLGLFLTIQQGRNAIQKAQEANEQADRSHTANLEVAMAQLRAYVSFSDVSIKNTPEGPKLAYSLVNSGQSPARRVTLAWEVRCQDFPPFNKQLASPIGDIPASERVVGCEFGGFPLPAEFRGFVTAPLIYYVVGSPVFYDVFGERRAEPTHFNLVEKADGDFYLLKTPF